LVAESLDAFQRVSGFFNYDKRQIGIRRSQLIAVNVDVDVDFLSRQLASTGKIV